MIDDVPEPLRRILAAREAVERAEQELAAARRDYFQAIVDARDAGQSLSSIGRALGVSRQRVATMIETARTD